MTSLFGITALFTFPYVWQKLESKVMVCPFHLENRPLKFPINALMWLNRNLIFLSLKIIDHMTY